MRAAASSNYDTSRYTTGLNPTVYTARTTRTPSARKPRRLRRGGCHSDMQRGFKSHWNHCGFVARWLGHLHQFLTQKPVTQWVAIATTNGSAWPRSAYGRRSRVRIPPKPSRGSSPHHNERDDSKDQLWLRNIKVSQRIPQMNMRHLDGWPKESTREPTELILIPLQDLRKSQSQMNDTL